jgi:type I restriction enzyme S subunit
MFGKRRAYQRKLAVADFEGVCSGDIYVFEPKDPTVLLPELLPFICQTDAFFEHAIGTSAGSLSPRTNWTSLAKYEFSVPSLAEQRRMVCLLSAFNHVQEANRNALSEIEAVLASTLNVVFPLSPFSTNISLIPLSSLIKSGALEFQTGPFGTVLAAHEYRHTGWPIINPTNIKNGRIVFENGPCVDDAKATMLLKYRMKPDDVILARKGEIDKACLARSAHEGWIVGSDCIRLRFKKEVLHPKYMLYFLQSPFAARMLASHAHGTVMPGLNEKMLGKLLMYNRSLNQQIEWLERLDELTSGLLALRQESTKAAETRGVLLAKLFSRSENGF